MTRRSTLAWMWLALILVLCWLPSGWMPVPEVGTQKPPGNTDKAVHFTLFAVFAFLWAGVVRREGFARLAIVFLGGLAMATITELGQEWSFIGRDGNLADGLADMCGVVAGLAVYTLTSLRVKTPSAETP